MWKISPSEIIPHVYIYKYIYVLYGQYIALEWFNMLQHVPPSSGAGYCPSIDSYGDRIIQQAAKVTESQESWGSRMTCDRGCG